MTWIVGYRSWNFGALFGDIRISTANGPVADFGVQKVHKLADNVIGGFAGNIHIGFSVLVSFAKHFSGGLVDLPAVLPPIVEAMEADYASVAPEQERAGGCHVLLAGTGPKKGVDAATGEELSWTDEPCFGFKIEMPFPDEAGIAVSEMAQSAATSIGSGAQLYVNAVDYDPNFLLSVGEMATNAGDGGMFFIQQVLGRAFTDAVQASPHPTVADQVIAAAVLRNRVGFADNYEPYGTVTQNGVPLPEKVAPFPPIARSWTEVKDLAQQHGLAADLIALATG